MSTYKSDLRVFSNDAEWVIAHSANDANQVCFEATGANGEEEGFTWNECPPGQTMKVWCNAKGEPDEPHGNGNMLVTKTMAGWAERGRGYLATTEI